MRACFHRLDFVNFVKVSFPQWFIYFANGQRLKFPFSLSSKLRVRPMTITLLPEKNRRNPKKEKKILKINPLNPRSTELQSRRQSLSLPPHQPMIFQDFLYNSPPSPSFDFFYPILLLLLLFPDSHLSLLIELGGRLRWHGVVDRQKRELRNATNLFSLTYIFGPKWRGLTGGYSIQSHWHYS